MTATASGQPSAGGSQQTTAATGASTTASDSPRAPGGTTSKQPAVAPAEPAVAAAAAAAARESATTPATPATPATPDLLHLTPPTATAEASDAGPSGVLPASHWAQVPVRPGPLRGPLSRLPLTESGSQQAEDESDFDDVDSAYGDDSASSTASLSASILEYRTVHGRTYHSERGNAQSWCDFSPTAVAQTVRLEVNMCPTPPGTPTMPSMTNPWIFCTSAPPVRATVIGMPVFAADSSPAITCQR